MKKLKNIILTFENCDSMEILAKYIRSLYIKKASDIIEQVYYADKDREVEIETYKSAQEIYFIVKDSKNLTYKPFDLFESDTVFNRLMEFSDITHITLVYFDGSRQTITAPYEDEYNDDNKYQSTIYVRGFDDLIISIEEEK